MEINLLTIGKTKIPFIIEGISEYTKRLSRYTRFTIGIIPDVKSKSIDKNMQKELEGAAILMTLSSSDFVVLLDERGREFSSVEFASYIEKISASGRKRLVFVVGGPYGFCQKVYDRADAKISLSRMTFNHEMVRLFFIEQLYRAHTILRGEPYHHD